MTDRPREVATLFGGAAILWAAWFLLGEVTVATTHSPHATAAINAVIALLYYGGEVLAAAALFLLCLSWHTRWRAGPHPVPLSPPAVAPAPVVERDPATEF